MPTVQYIPLSYLLNFVHGQLLFVSDGMAHLTVSFHLSTICYQVGSFFFFLVFFVFLFNLDIKTSTPCGLCDVSKYRAERSPTFLPTTRFSLERDVGRLSGASN
uniref:Uncharacterized protein n=1 Tax=Ixodes ricinus TaxID=34613 RepID=A0A6B0UFZ5_IXORI